jgi:hypothetical protein
MRGDADAIARLLAEVRAVEPRPAEEPDWDAMARQIHGACAEQSSAAAHHAPQSSPVDAAVDAEPRRGAGRAGRLPALRPARWAARWRAAPTALRTSVGVVGAAAVAAIIVFLTRPDARPTAEGRGAAERTAGRSLRETPPSAGTADAPGDAAPHEIDAALAEGAEDDGAGEGSPADLGDLDGLAAIEDDLDDTTGELDRALATGATTSFIADLLAADDDAGPEPATSPTARSEDPDDDGAAIDPFETTDLSALDRMADELDDQDIEALDRFLAEVHAG